MSINEALLSLYRFIFKTVRPNSGLTVLSFNPVVNYLFTRMTPKQKIPYFGNSEIEVDIMDYHGRILWIFGSNDFKVSRTVNMLLEPGMNFLDIGANYGSIGFAAIESVGKMDEIHFFEPQPDLAEKLRHTAVSIPTKQCHIHEIAIFDQSGEMELTLAENHSGVASRLYASRPDHGRVSPDGWIFRDAGAGWSAPPLFGGGGVVRGGVCRLRSRGSKGAPRSPVATWRDAVSGSTRCAGSHGRDMMSADAGRSAFSFPPRGRRS